MTEEIIIDGVNVAGCIYYKQECIANCGMFALGDFKCEGQICLYKQLKISEQENKELKEKIIKLSEEKGYLIVENNTLKEKNEGLKIKHQRYRECSMQLNKKYKSVLEEIRKIAKNPILSYRESVINIQDKINEVLNDT